MTVRYAVPRRGVPSAAAFRRWVAAALAGRTPHAAVDVRVVGSREARTLNRTWRGRDYATNVLSFPIDLPQVTGLPLLGDIVLCAPVVKREARAQHKQARAHWAHLVVHGTLHLLGYDHEQPAEAAVMEATEIEILARLGYDNPYEPRPARARRTRGRADGRAKYAGRRTQ